MTKDRLQLVYIEFMDHCSRAEWVRKEDVKDGAIMVYAVGWLSGEDKDNYYLSGQLTADGDFGDTITIVKGAVKKKKVLRVKL